MRSVGLNDFFKALRNAVTEYKDGIPVLNHEQVVRIFEQVKGSRMDVTDIPQIAEGYEYVGIDYPDVDDFWHEWYSEREQADGQR